MEIRHGYAVLVCRGEGRVHFLQDRIKIARLVDEMRQRLLNE
ncbi:hypothetical protein PV761_20595 [Arthrobacter sp. CC3]